MVEYALAAVLAAAAVVFLTSAATKLRRRSAYRSYRAGLGEARLVPARMLPATAAALAGSELAAALLLIAAEAATALGHREAEALTRLALITAAILTATLTAGVAVVTSRGTQARCACFGTRTGSALRPAHLIRNLTLLAVQLGGLITSIAGDAHLGGPGRPTPVIAAIAVATAAGAVLALLLIQWDSLIELFAS
jgi:hypothetical protein